jgi:hypothetical protein
MARESLAAVVEARLDEGVDARHLDLCVDLVTCDCPLCRRPERRLEVIASAGGRWDRARKAYTDEAETSRRLSVQEAQHAAARWFAGWLAARRRGRHVLGPDATPCFTLALVGGRRGGKSDLGEKVVITYCVDVPGAIGWITISEEDESPEIEAVLEREMPQAFYRKVGLTYHLANGSTIEILSTYDPDDAKRGRCDIALMNEAQKQREKVYVNLAAAAADRGGLVVLAANPPDRAAGEWVADLVDRSRAKQTDEVVFEIDPRRNPHVEQAALAAIAKRTDERTYKREVLGIFMPREDTVFYAFNPSPLHGNVRELGRGDAGERLIEVTRTFLARKLGAPTDRAWGFDFQWAPWMAAVGARFFEDPRDPAGDPIVWFVHAIQAEQTDEEGLLDAVEREGGAGMMPEQREAWKAGGFDPVVIDASGEWQDAERTKGRASADVMRRRGWRRIHLPDAKSKRNPLVSERVSVLNGLFCNALGWRKAFVLPECIDLIRALKLLENRNGVPHKRSNYMHICDGASYLTYRLFPRRIAPTARLEFKTVEPPPRGDWL